MYSISKKINYQLCNFYNSNYNLKIKHLNLPNVFGENDLNFNRIIPFLVKIIFFKKKFLIKKKRNKITFIYIDDLLKVLVDDRKKLRNTYLISIHELKIKIGNFMNLKENLQRNNFEYLFDFNLYKTIEWYKCYFKKKNESCNISRG
jgi:nucleoside-diphosphate-sugar epimerase